MWLPPRSSRGALAALLLTALLLSACGGETNQELFGPGDAGLDGKLVGHSGAPRGGVSGSTDQASAGRDAGGGALALGGASSAGLGAQGGLPASSGASSAGVGAQGGLPASSGATGAGVGASSGHAANGGASNGGSFTSNGGSFTGNGGSFTGNGGSFTSSGGAGNGGAGNGGAGNGGAGNGGAGRGGAAAGTSGGSADCETLATRAQDSLIEAQRCRTDLGQLPCTGTVTDECGCLHPVDRQASQATSEYEDAVKLLGKQCSVGCLELACPPYLGATCRASSGEVFGRCVATAQDPL